MNKTYKVKTHWKTGNEFIRHSYTATKTTKWDNVTFEQKFDMIPHLFGTFSTENEEHLKRIEEFNLIIKHFKALKGEERKTFKTKINALLSASYPEFVNVANADPRKLALMLFDLNLSVDEVKI
jgi:hypothetical protein